MKPKLLPSVSYLSECFDLDSDTGLLIWKRRPISHFATEKAWKISNTNLSGKVAGLRHHTGYVHIGINGKKFMAHRIVWSLYTNKPCDDLDIDHINRNRADNRPVNLRVCSRSENLANQGVRTKSTTGVKNLFHCKERGGYRYAAMRNGERVEKRFATLELALTFIDSLKGDHHG